MAESFVQSRIEHGKVTVFGRAGCPYSTNAVEMLKNVAPGRLRVVDIGGSQELQDYLRQTTGWRNVPYVFVGNTYIGGLCELQTMYQNIPRMLQQR